MLSEWDVCHFYWRDLRTSTEIINQKNTINAKKQPFINFLSKGKWIKSIIALFLELCHFLKENATVLSWPFMLRTEGEAKVRIFFVASEGSIFWLGQKSEHINTECKARLNVKFTFQQTWLQINLASSTMIKLLHQYQRQHKEWFSSVVVSLWTKTVIITYIHMITVLWGASMCQIQPDGVKYCCVNLWILVHEVCGPWNCIISRQYLWADGEFLHTVNPEAVRKPVLRSHVVTQSKI